MPENNDKQSWPVKLVIIGGSAILSSVLSGILGFFVDVIFFGWYEMALFGFLVGAPAGFVIAGGIAWYLLGRGTSTWKVVGTSLLGALLISPLIVAFFSS